MAGHTCSNGHISSLNVCYATQVHKRFTINAQRMHHRCTMDASLMYNESTKDALWTHNGCYLKAQRMHREFIHMYHGCARNASQVHHRCTLNALGAPGMPHACFTDAPRIIFRCTMNALRLSTDVSWAPHRYVFTMDVPWIQYACTAYAEAGSLSLDNLVCLFVYERSQLFFKMLLVLHLYSDSFHITHISSVRGPIFGLCSAWRYGEFWRPSIFFFKNGFVYRDATT